MTAIGAEQSKMGRATDAWRCPTAAFLLPGRGRPFSSGKLSFVSRR
jgi:hypothetical protein